MQKQIFCRKRFRAKNTVQRIFRLLAARNGKRVFPLPLAGISQILLQPTPYAPQHIVVTAPALLQKIISALETEHEKIPHIMPDGIHRFNQFAVRQFGLSQETSAARGNILFSL